MAYSLIPGLPPHFRPLRARPSPTRASLAAAQAPTELIRDGVVIAREAAHPLRRLAARHVVDWAQGLGEFVAASGRPAAGFLEPALDAGRDRRPAPDDPCNSEEIVLRALAALRANGASEPVSHVVRRRRQPGIGSSPA